MSADIYFFSGTGNTLVVARSLAAELDGRHFPLAAYADHGPFSSYAEVVGIVYPVYYMGLPPIVRRFAENLKIPAGGYVFSLATYGGGIGDSAAELRGALESHGQKLDAAFGVHMPQNGFRKSWENHEKLHAAWHTRKLPRIADAIRSREKGTAFGAALGKALVSPLSGWFKGKIRTHLAEVTGLAEDAPLDELFARSDVSFSVTADCTKCGICSRVCPVGNIRMTDAGPEWQHRCENCLACYHWCPQRAVRTAIGQEGYFYRSPEVSVADMQAIGRMATAEE